MTQMSGIKEYMAIGVGVAHTPQSILLCCHVLHQVQNVIDWNWDKLIKL